MVVYIAFLLLLVRSAVVALPTPFRRCVPSQRNDVEVVFVARFLQECVLRAQIPTSVSTEE